MHTFLGYDKSEASKQIAKTEPHGNHERRNLENSDAGMKKSGRGRQVLEVGRYWEALCKARSMR